MNPSRRIPELDGIRGLAIALVLVLHYFVSGIVEPAPGTFFSYVRAASQLAWSGVDLFFVLSGFLIGGILLDSRDSPDYFRRFYKRRFFRIVPIYAVMLALYWLFVTLVRPEEKQFPWWPYVLYLQNFWMAVNNKLGQFAATWSLAIEEQFYLTLPAIVRVVNPRLFPLALGIGIVGALLLRSTIAVFAPAHPEAAIVLMPCRADALLLGVAGAWLLRSKFRSIIDGNHRILRVAFGILLAGISVMAYRSRHGSATDGLMLTIGATWVALVYLALILLVVTQPHTWLGACFRWRGLRALGAISYAVYLSHQLALSFLIHVAAPLSPLLITFLAFALTITVCSISWRFFEKPLIDLGHQPRHVP
jgi:peptidoglycan/LPS O-acetylase OafA/YrhL